MQNCLLSGTLSNSPNLHNFVIRRPFSISFHTRIPINNSLKCVPVFWIPVLFLSASDICSRFLELRTKEVLSSYIYCKPVFIKYYV